VSKEFLSIGVSALRYMGVQDLRVLQDPVVIQNVQKEKLAVLIPYGLYLAMQEVYFSRLSPTERIQQLKRDG
jgi:type III secretion system FlhB-like substrate exporter